MSKEPRRIYTGHNGERLPGVTSILGLLNKPALLGWAARVAAEATAEAIFDGGASREVAVLTGKNAHNKKRDKAADLGTLAHELVEMHYTDGAPLVDVSIPDNAKAHGAYQRVVEHMERTATRVIRSEVALSDPAMGFGGTLDFVLERGGALYIGDLKTGKAAYDEVIIQLAAYRWLWSKHEPDMPLAGGGLLIHSPIDGVCTEVMITPAQLDVGQHIFGALVEVYKNLDKCKLDRPEIEKGIP